MIEFLGKNRKLEIQYFSNKDLFRDRNSKFLKIQEICSNLNYLFIIWFNQWDKFRQIFAKKLVTLHGNRIEGLDYVQSVNILVLWLNVHSVEIPIIYSHVPNLLKISSNWLESKFLVFPHCDVVRQETHEKNLVKSFLILDFTKFFN